MEFTIESFRMPRYRELPDVGLYLDQTVKYINRYLAPLGCVEITASMISNYVKKGYIASPVRKQYDAEQIAYLFFIAIAKSALPMEHIAKLFHMQKEAYPSDVAYDYFCVELENILHFIFGLREDAEDYGDHRHRGQDHAPGHHHRRGAHHLPQQPVYPPHRACRKGLTARFSGLFFCLSRTCAGREKKFRCSPCKPLFAVLR